MDETEALVRTLAESFAQGVLRHGEHASAAGGGAPPFRRLTFREAFAEHAGLDPVTDPEGRLGMALRAAGVKAPRPANREQLVDLLLALVVQPKLGLDRPCFLTDWPTERAALARIRKGRDSDQGLSAARFELYACGVELCNGYFELLDPVEQRTRIASENAKRIELGKHAYPVDEAFLAALEAGLPSCAGNALGVDRLLMLLTGGESLADVRSFLLDLP
jgi:lysyl-tRNA synthetase class 2